ncbi:MAG: hypothetical protein QOE77_3009 [Blastocatellia bacterium]|jgi:hypothetical protein|nr:hypothetical protein [Blastocatellia bacterium]
MLSLKIRKVNLHFSSISCTGSGPALESLARLEDTMRFIELRGWAPFSRTEQPLAF